MQITFTTTDQLATPQKYTRTTSLTPLTFHKDNAVSFNVEYYQKRLELTTLKHLIINTHYNQSALIALLFSVLKPQYTNNHTCRLVARREIEKPASGPTISHLHDMELWKAAEAAARHERKFPAQYFLFSPPPPPPKIVSPPPQI